MNNVKKKWFFSCVVSILCGLLCVILLVYIFDPYIHYHKPFPFVKYRLYYERYINDGISRNFEFDTMITGTSMAQNYKTSELDALFGVQSVKETFSGAGFKEISDNIDRALRRNKALNTVIWSLDYNAIIRDKDWAWYGGEGIPDYLYDDSIWNDYQYVFNKDVLFHGVMNNMLMTLMNQPSTTMDEYSSWEKPLGLKYILGSYNRNNVADYLPEHVTDEEYEMIVGNITQNIVALANKYPDKEFIIFYTPYSICYWDSLLQEKTMERQFETEQITTELLLQCPNVKLYNFFDHTDVVCNLDNYRDKEHYGAHINSQILQWLLEDEPLTEENYLDRLEEEKEFFRNYDYDAIYK